MDSYTITIAPNDDSGAATRLVVDTSGDQVRITDVHLHAPQGLASGYIPTVDFDLLMQAVTGTVTTPTGQSTTVQTALNASHGTPALEAATATEPTEQAAAPASPKGRTRKATPRAAPRSTRARTATAASADESSTPRRAARGAARSTAGAVTQPSARVAGKAATAKTPPVGKRTAASTEASAKGQTPGRRTRAATTTAAPTTSGRVYRRTPDDLAAVVVQVETVAGVAEHYQVPRHTAQGWVRRLRATA